MYNPRKSTDAPYGPISSYKYTEAGIVSPLYLCFRARHKINPAFFERYFRSPVWHRYIYMTGDSGARHDRVSIKDDTFFAMPVNLPTEQEQERIAAFLKKLEDKIEKQRSLVEALKKYKRGLICTALTPETCRLKEIQWTTARIGNLGRFIKGASLSKADIADEGTPFILYGELYTTYNEVINRVLRKTKAYAEERYYSRIGDVIIPTSGETPEEISTASCVMLPNVILAGDLNIFRTEIIDGRILSYILKHLVNGKIARVAQGKSVVHVQASEIEKIEITYPDAASQRKMIAAFDAVNRRIENAEQTLAHLIRQQKALLQSLFI